MNTPIAQKRVAVISGGTGYVGSAVAVRLAKDGMSVAVLHNSSPESRVQELLTTLEGFSHKAYKCNLQNAGEVTATIDTIEKEMGNIYACVHAAGGMPKPKQLHLSPLEDLKEQFTVNVFGSFNFLSSCATRLKEHKEGILIGITTAGVVTQSNTKARGTYSVVKFAVQGMLVALKEELASSNVRVYSVAPGVMEGGMNSGTPKAFIEIVKHASPTGTITNAMEVADKISYLCSDASIGVTDLTFLMAPETGTA